MAKLEVARKQSGLALKWSLSKQKEADIRVSLKPTCIILPEQGCYRKLVVT
jgi:hypothetical protein